MRRLFGRVLLVVSFVVSVIAVVAVPAPFAAATVGQITFYAGFDDGWGYSGNCTDPLVADLNEPSGVSVAANGDVRFAVEGSNRLREVTHDGANIAAYAGTGDKGFAGDGGPAVAALVDGVSGVVVDGSGGTYLTDAQNHRVRYVHASGTISTVAGNGTAGGAGDGGLAVDAELDGPRELALSPDGTTLVIGESDGQRIRVVDLPSGRIDTLVAGLQPSGLAIDEQNIYVSSAAANRVWAVTLAGGGVSEVAGTGVAGFSGDGGPAVSAQLAAPSGLALLDTKELLVADSANNRVRLIEIPDGSIMTVAGSGVAGGAGDGGPALAAELAGPAGLAVGPGGVVTVSERQGHRLRQFDVGGSISRLAGSGTPGERGDTDSDCWTADGTRWGRVRDIVVDADGNVYVADSGNDRVRRVDAVTGLVSTVAGNGSSASNGDGGLAVDAAVGAPGSLGLDAAGNLYIGQLSPHCQVRKVDMGTGVITHVAGSGTCAAGGNGVPAATANMGAVLALSVAPDGDLLLVTGVQVHRLEVASGLLWDLEHLPVVPNSSIRSVVSDSAGHYYVALTVTSSQAGIVYRVDPVTGVQTHLAGSLSGAFGGDGGPAADATMGSVVSMAVDDADNLYLAFPGPHRRVRKIDMTTGIITTVAGNGSLIGLEAGGPGIATEVAVRPDGLAISPDGDLYITQGDGTTPSMFHGVRRVEFEQSTGLLRVTTSPAVPGSISVNGIVRDNWGLTWAEFPVGSHEVCFGAVAGFTPPPCEQVVVAPGQTTVLEGVYAPRGYLRATTSPAVPATIRVDGVPRNDWGMWPEVEPGTYEVCFDTEVEGFALVSDECTFVDVEPNETVWLEGEYEAAPGAPGPAAPHGFLRATTLPATPSRITVNGEWTDTWGLTWVKMAPGSYEVCFEPVLYATAPPCQQIDIVDGQTTEVVGEFVAHGFLQVFTDPAAPAMVHIDGHRANAWGAYPSLEPGEYSVCFSRLAFLWAPSCQVVEVTAGATTAVTGTYTVP